MEYIYKDGECLDVVNIDTYCYTFVVSIQPP